VSEYSLPTDDSAADGPQSEQGAGAGSGESRQERSRRGSLAEFRLVDAVAV